MPEKNWSTHIDTVCAHVIAHYVFPDVAEHIITVLRQRLADGSYDAIHNDEEFADAVTTDLQSVNGDKHLRLRHFVDPIPERDESRIPDQDAYRAEVALDCGGIGAVQRLDGNVGYLDIRAMHDPAYAGHTAVAAMTILAHTDALIFDVRRNGGGDPGLIALYCSYLFDEHTHLNDLYWRAEDSTQQWWTLPYVPGPRFGATKPVYVLTSPDTFSGAEEFCYNLQTRRRATIIGETTKGGAHPADRYRVDTHLAATVPSGRAINPITGTNWEGTGVEPDIKVPAAEAFTTAYRLALDHVLTLNSDGPRRAVSTEASEARSALDTAAAKSP